MKEEAEINMPYLTRSVFLAVIVAITVALSGNTVQAASVDLTAKLRLCRETYVRFWRPLFGEDRDYCHVFDKEGDVSDERGVQWDVIDVIDSVSRSLAKEKHPDLRSLASDLAQCVSTYPRDGRASTRYPDWCLVTPSKAMKTYFVGVKDDYSTVEARFSLPDVLEAAWHALKSHRKFPVTFKEAEFVVRGQTRSRVIHVTRRGDVYHVTVSKQAGKETHCVAAKSGRYLGPC